MTYRKKVRNLDPAYLQSLGHLDTTEASVYLRSSPSTLAKYRCYGGGPQYIQVSPRKVLYTRAALDAWLASRARTDAWEGAA